MMRKDESAIVIDIGSVLLGLILFSVVCFAFGYGVGIQ